MNEKENEGFIPCKKFKSSNENNEETCCRKNKSNILSTNKSETEAGSYFLGPIVKKFVHAPFTQCLAREKGTDNYYLMKILVLDDSNTLVRRTLFHNEYSILSLLRNHFGVIQLHDFFKDNVYEKDQKETNSSDLKRVCMVLECLIPHGHHNSELIPLHRYLKKDRISEIEALHIFYNLLLVIEDLHKRNIVHQNLKLSKIILNRKTLKVKLIDFYYAKLLTSDSEVQYKHRRTSLYSSPDVLAKRPVLPKTCDMWSAGVILYAMLSGWMTFAEASNFGSCLPSNRISFLEALMSNIICILDGTKEILRSILCEVPMFRLKASEAVDMVSTLLALQSPSQSPSLYGESKYSDQIVPECPDFDNEDKAENKQLIKDSKSSNISWLRTYTMIESSEIISNKIDEEEDSEVVSQCLTVL